jgi:universal stress protein A
MENIENILVPLTVNKDSKNILDHAISIAEKFNAKIVVFHVLREPKMDLSEINYESGFLQKIRKQQEEEVERELRSLIPEEYYEKYNLSTEMTSGQPFLEIVNKAKSLNADLIVMGTHGRSGLSHVLLGSVAEKVLRLAPCPVMIIRSKDYKFEPI